MADELRIALALQYNKDGNRISRIETFSVDVTGAFAVCDVQAVAVNSEQTLQVTSDMGTYGFVYVKNLDSTNYIKLHTYTGMYSMTLLAGESCIFRCNHDVIYVRAYGDTCNVEYALIED